MASKKLNEFDSLEECIEFAKKQTDKIKKGKSALIFSPGAKSFEKFKNEFDRGEKFNKIIKEKFGL